jgi:hypothetical protein
VTYKWIHEQLKNRDQNADVFDTLRGGITVVDSVSTQLRVAFPLGLPVGFLSSFDFPQGVELIFR